MRGFAGVARLARDNVHNGGGKGDVRTFRFANSEQRSLVRFFRLSRVGLVSSLIRLRVDGIRVNRTVHVPGSYVWHRSCVIEDTRLYYNILMVLTCCCRRLC